MPGANLAREEAQERAAMLDVDRYEVDLDLSGAPDPERPAYRSVSTIRFRCSRPGAETFLDLLAPEVESVVLNGRALDPAEVFDGTRVRLEGLAAENTVTVTAQCAYSRSGEGLHRFADPEDGETYLYTQYEPADARRVFANFEQPDLKASFAFTVTAPAGWTVLSNTAAAEPSATTGTTATWTFPPTERISTYITAIIAGPYHRAGDHYTRTFEDGTELEIPLGAFCRKALAPHFDADEVFTVTKQGLDFFHERFDFPYPFGKYDQVFVPEYNLGAMENPGCVTFTEEYVFRGRTTDSAHQGRANTILHEMAHMWFGDLVTMEWWDDLWLKESFADFMGAFALDGATRWHGSAWVTFANRRKAWAYRADQLPSTHPITADIPDLEAAKLNFDGITYAKGASVLKQLVAYVGQEEFLEGARRYFKRHAYGNTRLGDLLSALEETSGRDLASWSKAWLQTAGVNVLTPRVSYAEDDTVASFEVVQDAAVEALPALRPHRIVVGVYEAGRDGRLVRTARHELDVDGPVTAVPELVGRPRPDLVLLNDEDLTFAKVRFDEDSLATLRSSLGDIEDRLARALAWSALWNMTRDGVLPAREFLDIVQRFAGRETEIGVLQQVHAQAVTALELYADPSGVADARHALAAAARAALRAAEPGSGHQLAWARFFAAVADREDEFATLRALRDGSEAVEGLEVDTELRWTLLEPLVSAGVEGGSAEDVEAEARRDATASGARHRARLLATRPDADVKREAWASVVDDDALTNAIAGEIIDGFNRASQVALTAEYAEPYFEALERVWGDRSIEMAMRVVRGLYPRYLVSQPTLELTDRWLEGHPGAPAALRRLVVEARDDLARALTARRADASL
ncbi:aminopeptidase N [Mangrovactinospora gilvigrisea]|uniref:Aminopeptidase N n=1 Tax=Mangrovactinospora gilvigrisea TaxID=1428644 RepID=A0A1J7BGA9_9ACTN|nr:aminopeptidase N [Mangrovactinospora gilvigrisea]OIV37711.1 aminopeptidase N [Mangrovactinospora gilvigrisea]